MFIAAILNAGANKCEFPIIFRDVKLLCQECFICNLLSVSLEVLEKNFIITKTRLYSFDSLKPHFYTLKLGFTGVYINYLISAQKHRLWVLFRTASPRWFL